MARWIHEFRSLGERTLSEGERKGLCRRALAFALGSVLFAVLAIVALLGVVVGIAFAAGGNLFG